MGLNSIVEFLAKKGIAVEANPNAKISEEAYAMVAKEFGNEQSIKDKEAAKKVVQKKPKEVEEELPIEKELIIKNVDATVFVPEKPVVAGPKVLDKIDLDAISGKKPKAKPEPVEEPKPKAEVKQEKSEALEQPVKPEKAPKAEKKEVETIATTVPEIAGPKVLDKIDLNALKKPKKKTAKKEEEAPVAPRPAAPKVEAAPAPEEKVEAPIAKKEIEFIPTQVEQLTGPKVMGTIDLKQFKKEDVAAGGRRGKRERIKKGAVDVVKEGKEVTKEHEKRKKEEKKAKGKRPFHQEVAAEEVDKQIKDTLAKMLEKGTKHKGAAKRRHDKREAISQRMQEEQEMQEQERQILKLSEFVTANDLAKMMDISVNEVIAACMDLGLMVSINQRLDAEAIALIVENFGRQVEFVTGDTEGAIEQEEDKPEELVSRPPIVTVMGHVDHGKTSLLDSIRNANVIAGEAGGITQHIGAYHVELDGGRMITFLDTPGHEAFTAMRARGAKVTDVTIIVVAADDSVMPQTVEAINHAVAAGVPMIFAINKIDKAGANPDKIREQLSAMNYLVEDWGGKYQVQEIAAKSGLNIDKLLEKVLLEADMLELKANPNKRASGSIIESLLDKGRGYVSRMLVHSGTLRMGDLILSGTFTGRVKAMYNERGQKIKEAGPSMPVEILGLNGAPTAGETFNVMADEREARDIANKREQLKREQGLRTQKHITLDEIGRRLAIGSFKELNIIVKGDVDGSVEALTDSLLKLSTEQVQLNVIHKAVGAISESDVHLAAASEAIIVGFQVRPSAATRKLAEQEQIEIRTYSIIYDAIEEIKDAIAGMHAPEFREEVVCSVEVQQVFKVTKVGTVAGCIVREGKITRNTKVRLIRDGIVIHQGELASLKRFKDDVKEVGTNFECGLNLANFNDIKEGDIIEGYESVQVKK